jgi:cell division protein FtsL
MNKMQLSSTQSSRSTLQRHILSISRRTKAFTFGFGVFAIAVATFIWKDYDGDGDRDLADLMIYVDEDGNGELSLMKVLKATRLPGIILVLVVVLMQIGLMVVGYYYIESKLFSAEEKVTEKSAAVAEADDRLLKLKIAIEDKTRTTVYNIGRECS